MTPEVPFDNSADVEKKGGVCKGMANGKDQFRSNAPGLYNALTVHAPEIQDAPARRGTREPRKRPCARTDRQCTVAPTGLMEREWCIMFISAHLPGEYGAAVVINPDPPVAHKRLPPSPFSHRASVSPSQYSFRDGHRSQVVDSIVTMNVAINGLLYPCPPCSLSSSSVLPSTSFPVPVSPFRAALLSTARDWCPQLRHVGTSSVFQEMFPDFH